MKKYYFCILCILSLLLLFSCSAKDNTVQATEDAAQNTKEAVTTEKALTEVTTPTKAQKAVPTIIPTATPTKAPAKSVTVEETKKEDNSKYIIVIDAGHQKHGNYDKEPIGPGAKKKKAKVSSGTQGRFTDVPEYKVNLAVSQKLRDILTEQGYQVIMIRETNAVDISNAERAKIANENQADVFVRIHCNGSEDSSVHGILTICPTKNNPYCSEIYKDSRRLSDLLLDNLCDITGAKNKGVTETDTMSGINWSKVPVSIIEMGYMTNKKEDYKLTDTKYQKKLAQGIADGIEEYLK